jgi:cytochrome oxidase assembly protein ShyY1
MTRRLPVLTSIIVAAVVATLIALGVWQLRRAEWKEGLLDRYREAQMLPPISWPTLPVDSAQLPLFRHATGVCLRPVGRRALAGENRAGESGYAHIVDCRTGAEGPGMSVEVGWSKNPSAAFNWSGGPVSGIIVPDRQARIRLVAASAPAGLQPSKVPDVSTISAVTPAGHRGYAATWFIFALIAPLIYALALRRKWHETETEKP